MTRRQYGIAIAVVFALIIAAGALYTLIGALTWDVGFAVGGYYLGESWRTVEKYIQPITIAIGVILVGLITWWILKRVRARKAAREAGPTPAASADSDGSAPAATDVRASDAEIAAAGPRGSTSVERE